MKFKIFLVGCLGGLLFLNFCINLLDMIDYVVYVNLFIGIGGYGYIFLGVIVFYGMIFFSLDICIDGWDVCLGYYYVDFIINGFLYIYLSGIGCCDYGDVLLMFMVGE